MCSQSVDFKNGIFALQLGNSELHNTLYYLELYISIPDDTFFHFFFCRICFNGVTVNTVQLWEVADDFVSILQAALIKEASQPTHL